MTGSTSAGTIDGSSSTTSIGGNDVRGDLANQFNELRDQLDKISDDASFNGINLLRGDNLKITFNETGTSTIDIQTKNGETINAGTLKLSDIKAEDLDSDANIDKLISTVKDAVNTVRSQSSAFGSNLSIVENRQDFTKSMMNTAADRCRQSGAGRRQRGSGEHAGPPDPSAALFNGSVAGLPGRSGRRCVCSKTTRIRGFSKPPDDIKRRGLWAPPFFVAAVVRPPAASPAAKRVHADRNEPRPGP